jgi:dTDP-4-dehydrorhamnose 3,5-epimerase
MQIEPTSLPGCVIITPQVHADQRGVFKELYHAPRFSQHGLPAQFLQDNFSRSSRGTLRGLHYQRDFPQGKLVQVLQGAVFDVAVDLRRSSPTFGQWAAVTLSAETHQQFYIPPGCAHGFYVLSESADFLYKCTEIYRPEDERVLQWNDPALNIPWPLQGPPVLSVKDQQGSPLSDCATFA